MADDRTFVALHARVLHAAAIPGVLGAAARHHLAVPGKQLRGRLAHGVASALGADAATALDVATAIELLHNASLVHDDVQDGDALRRGRETVWLRFGRAVAINLGDHLLASAFAVLAGASAPPDRIARVVRAFAAATTVIARGQSDELLRRDDLQLDLQRYEQIARDKTGPLLALPIESAAALAGADDGVIRVMRDGGLLLGTAYQLADDVADLLDRKQRGQAGADLCEGKLTWPLLDFLQSATSADQRGLLELLAAPERRISDVQPWVRAIRAAGSVARTLARVHELVGEARVAWSSLPPGCASLLDAAARRFLASLPADDAAPAPIEVAR